MQLPKLPEGALLYAVAGVGLVGAFGLWAWSKGGVQNAASAAGSAAAQAAIGAATGVVSGGVDVVSEGVGIPTTSDTTTDPYVARWLIDGWGYFTASLWSGAPALLHATFMDSGSGHPPPAGSAIALHFGTQAPITGQTSGDFSRMDRAQQTSPADDPGSWDWANIFGGLGA